MRQAVVKRLGRERQEGAWARMTVQDDDMKAVRPRHRPQDPIKVGMMSTPEPARLTA